MSALSTFLAVVNSEIGKPYVFGATGPNSFDCSGLVQYALSIAGIKAPRLAMDQKACCTPVTNPQPGDLVFYGNSHANGHVCIYIGGGKVINASEPGVPIRIQNVWQGDSSQPGPYYGRVPGLGAATAGLTDSIGSTISGAASAVSSSVVGPILDGAKGIMYPLGIAAVGIGLVVIGGWFMVQPKVKQSTNKILSEVS